MKTSEALKHLIGKNIFELDENGIDHGFSRESDWERFKRESPSDCVFQCQYQGELAWLEFVEGAVKTAIFYDEYESQLIEWFANA